MKQATEEQIEAFKAKHGEVRQYDTPQFGFVFRSPAAVEYERFTARIAKDPASAMLALKRLVLDVTLYPDAKEAAAYLEAKPGIVPKVATEVQKFAADEDGEQAKKL
jgi:hypothetical protein